MEPLKSEQKTLVFQGILFKLRLKIDPSFMSLLSYIFITAQIAIFCFHNFASNVANKLTTYHSPPSFFACLLFMFSFLFFFRTDRNMPLCTITVNYCIQGV